IPISVHARMTRTAISPRFAIRIFLNMVNRQPVYNPTMTGAPVYRIEDLRFGYSDTPVLKGISATIGIGDFVALVGPNGAGKSTFLKVLSGLIRRYTGQVEFDGVPLAKLNSRDLARRVAFVPQETHMVFPFTVSQMVLMGRSPHQAA